jgi:hypothetical protein
MLEHCANLDIDELEIVWKKIKEKYNN